MNTRFTPSTFATASKAWMANKIRHGAMLYYKCEATLKTGKPCRRMASQKDAFQFLDKHYCTQHAQLALRNATM